VFVPAGTTGSEDRAGSCPARDENAENARSAAVYALTKWLNCSPIYVVNRDDAEAKSGL
jgi:hypothetical protein